MGINVDSKDLLQILNIPKRKVFIIAFAVMLFTGLVLFLPEEVINKLYLNGIKNSIGTILGIIFLISAVIIIVLLTVLVFDFFKKKYIIKATKKKIRKYLLNCKNKAVIDIIKSLLRQEDHTEKLQINNGAVAELTHRGIISLTTSNNPVDFGYDNEMYTNYFLQPFIVEIIREDVELKKKFNLK